MTKSLKEMIQYRDEYTESLLMSGALWYLAVDDAKELLSERDRLEAEVERLQAKCDGYAKENEEVMQHLGQALGYPYFADDQKNFPGATKADGVAVGEHVPVTLAIVAKKKIEQLSKTEAARNT